MPRGDVRGVKVFLSYAHKDDELRMELEEHLGGLKHEKLVNVWWDHQIQPGSDWGEEIARRVADDAAKAGVSPDTFIVTRAAAEPLLQALAAASERLTADFGTWKTPWGEINRFQRLTGDIVQPFNDAGPSIPVPFTSARWGSLASFGARTYPGTKKMYGTSGNSFVAVVEFGPRLRAWAVMAGGQSGDIRSPHFADQAQRYAAGALRPVYFHPDELRGHVARRYSPGGRSR